MTDRPVAAVVPLRARRPGPLRRVADDVARAVHDVSSPLTVIAGYCALLRAGGGPEYRERIFLPHVRGGDARGAGRGLGLAIARDTAREHGGSLTLERSPSGACFRLAVPLAPGSAEA